MNDIIYIKNLPIQAIIGVFEHEKHKAQKLLLDIEFTCDFSQAIATDAIEHTINYAKVVEFIEEFAEDTQFALLETFASALIEELFLHFEPQAIELKIEKPGAIVQTKNVGILLKRTRHSKNHL